MALSSDARCPTSSYCQSSSNLVKVAEKEVASMRRIMMLVAVAAMMLAMTAAPAFAQLELGDIPPPGDKEPGNAQPPKTDVINPTEQNGKNFIGESASNFVKGPGGNPGSAAQPTTFGGEDAFNGPVTSRIGTLDPKE